MLKHGIIVGSRDGFFKGVNICKLHSDDPLVAKDINKLCVRLAFCLYAEDAGLFSSHQAFYKYLSGFSAKGLNNALEKLFKVLDTKDEDRSANISEELDSFPYVNGGLFKDSIEIPELDDEFMDLLLNQASAAFDWKDISPTIFGAIFESTLNPETRRSGGMHYTSLHNIHKVIDSLFLNDLKEEFKRIKSFKVEGTRIQRFKEFQRKLGQLRFMDPACGSGNFLTETFLCLRRLENDVMREIYGGQIGLDIEGFENPIYVTLDQFYGIEINDYAVAVAQTAMWIAESQMKRETERIIGRSLQYLPLQPYENIHCANALRIDWNNVIPASKINYIMGNPPFVGSKYASQTQKDDLDIAFENIDTNYRLLDYVCAWYIKAVKYMQDKDILCAFVSTNSICQGEQVTSFWKPLFQKFNLEIFFCYKTFIWSNETIDSAHVHCVIVGFHCNNQHLEKTIFTKKDDLIIGTKAQNINAYLVDAANVFIDSRNKPIFNVSAMVAPNKPCDYNKLKIEPDEYIEMISKYPETKTWIKKMVGAQEFINHKDRYCFWLVNCPPETIKNIKPIHDRVEACRKARLEANTAESLKLAKTPSLFREQINPDHYLLIPCVSSERRFYIPIGYLDKNTIPVMGTLIIPNATLYEFAVLTSSTHMSWMRTVAGRLKSDYRYSKDIVYNNFIWPNATEQQKDQLSKIAKEILDARSMYPNSTLASMYDPDSMPIELRNAHERNDKAVLALYGIPENATEEQIVSHLMKLYKDKADELNAFEDAKKTSKKQKISRNKKIQVEASINRDKNFLFTEDLVSSDESVALNKSNFKQSSSANKESPTVSDSINKNELLKKNEVKKEPRQMSIFEMLEEEDQ